jgi:hypothetical protein
VERVRESESDDKGVTEKDAESLEETLGDRDSSGVIDGVTELDECSVMLYSEMDGLVVVDLEPVMVGDLVGVRPSRVSVEVTDSESVADDDRDIERLTADSDNECDSVKLTLPLSEELTTRDGVDESVDVVLGVGVFSDMDSLLDRDGEGDSEGVLSSLGDLTEGEGERVMEGC